MGQDGPILQPCRVHVHAQANWQRACSQQVLQLIHTACTHKHMHARANSKSGSLACAGLDEAVLGFGPDVSGADGDPENNAKRVAALLEHGAHGLLSAGAQEGVEQASAAFQNADIDQVGKQVQ